MIEKKENKEKEKIRLALRRMLVPFLNHIHQNYTPTEANYLVDYDNPETVYYLLKIWSIHFSLASQSKKAETVTFFRKYSDEICASVQSLTPAMAQINPELMILNLGLVRTLTKLSHLHWASREFPYFSIKIIGAIAEIDELSFTGKGVKKNIQQLVNLDVTG